MKFSLLFILSSSLLFANLVEVEKFYAQQEYAKAISKAKSSTNDYNKVQLHLLWGKSALALQKNREAMSAFERVLILAPDNSQAKEALTLLYPLLKKDKLALALKQSINDPSIAYQSVNINQDETHPANRLKSNISVTFGYDSNVNVHHDTDELDIFYTTTNHTTKLASNFYLASIDISYMHEFANHFYWRTLLNGYYKRVTKESKYNLYLSTLSTGIGKHGDNYNIYLPINYSILHYLDVEYLHIHSITPQIDYIINPNFILNLNAKYEKREFKTFTTRDDKSIAVGVGGYYTFGHNYLFGDIEYQDYRTNSTIYQLYTNKTNWTYTVGVGYHWSDTIKMVMSYKLTQSEYEDNLSTTLLPSTTLRSDTYYQFNFKLSKTINKNLSLYFDEEYSKNDSNYIPADYHKNTMMVGLTYHY